MPLLQAKHKRPPRDSQLNNNRSHRNQLVMLTKRKRRSATARIRTKSE